MDAIPAKIAYYVLKSFDTEKMRINLRSNEFIPITEGTIHEILGIPTGGKIITSLTYNNEITKSWKSQFENSKIRAKDVKEKILSSRVADDMFLLNFLVLLINTMGLTDKSGILQYTFVGYLNNDEDIKRIDWCNFLLEIAKNGKLRWNDWDDDEEENYSGPISLLMLLYLDNTTCEGMDVVRKSPALRSWSFNLMNKREKLEMLNGCFGNVERNKYPIEHDTESDKNETEGEQENESDEESASQSYRNRLALYVKANKLKDCIKYLNEIHKNASDQKVIVIQMIKTYLNAFPESEDLKNKKEEFEQLYGGKFKIGESSKTNEKTTEDEDNEDEDK